MSCRLAGMALFLASFVAYSSTASAKDYVAEAEKLQAQGQLRAAEIELKNAIKDNPKDSAAHYRLAALELDMGNAAAAEFEARLARLGGYDPDQTVPLLVRAYLAQEKFNELLRDFPGTEGSANERARVLVARGTALIALGQAEKGLAAFDEAQALAPNLPEPLLARAKLAISKQDLGIAEKNIDQALTVAPHDNEARLLKANLLRVKGDIDGALGVLNSIINESPGYVLPYLERARIFIAKNEDNKAKDDVNTMLAVTPGNVTAIYLNAIIYIKAKDFKSASTELQKISAAIPSIPRGYYFLALAQYNLQQLGQAQDSAQRFVARNPDDLVGNELYAVIELALKHPADAASALEKFQSAGTADARALNILGVAFMQLGKAADAVAALDAAAKLAPQDPAIQLRLGISRLKTGDTAGLNDVEQSFELAPSAPAAELLVASELAAGNWDRAQAAVDRLKQAQPNSPVPDNFDALLKMLEFDLEGAQASFLKIAKANPDYLPAKLGLIRTLELQGKLDQAEGALDDLLRTKPANGAVLSRLVSVLLRDGKSDAAIAAAERAHAAAPSDRGITVGLIDLYLRVGRKDDALAVAQKAARSNDLADIPLMAARGRAEIAAGLNKEAEETYRHIIDIAPSRIDLRRGLGNFLASIADFAGARKAINEAMTVSPHNFPLMADLLIIDLKSSGVEAALATAHQLQQNDPELATEAPALEGDVYMAAQQYENAGDVYTKALHQKPSSMLVIGLARAKSAAGNTDGAIAVLTDWLRDHSTDTGVAEVLAGYEITQHRYDDALKHLEQVVATSRPGPIALNNLAWLYQRAGDPRARLLAERAYLMAPGIPQLADTLGWLLVQQNSAAMALGLLEEASYGDKQSLEIHYHLAVAFNDTGHKDKAIELLKVLTDDKATFDDKAAAVKLLAEISKS